MANPLAARLHEQELVDDFDLHFCDFIAERSAKPCDELSIAALLVTRASARGDVCVNLKQLGGQPVFAESEPALRAPAWQVWLELLRRSGVVGEPGDIQPLILDRHGRLYLYRYWDYEQRLCNDLLQRAVADPNINIEQLLIHLGQLFPASYSSESDWQLIAASTALLRRLCVISGGPGTGKTTTVVRILALLLLHNPNCRIGLAAPTGKAAARLQESIGQAKQSLPVDDAVRAAIPDQATTVHRLLGARPHSVYFRHDQNRTLDLDALVVDEASMIDLALMTKLVSALPETARLILLGDRDQLASVEAGSVLGDICGPLSIDRDSEQGAKPTAAFWTPAHRALLSQLPNPPPMTDVAETSGFESPIADSVALLHRSFRFSEHSSIARLARAVRCGDHGAAHIALNAGEDVKWQSLAHPDMLRRLLLAAIDDGLRSYFEAVEKRCAVDEIFFHFNQFRLLAALRGGPFGVEQCNFVIEAALAQRGFADRNSAWYPGRPIMITRNQHNAQLYNGDVGIALPDPDSAGQIKVHFINESTGSVRPISPSRLPAHETVYALTVHKSQGSEFDRVVLILPTEASPIVTRELLYTGITRARSNLEIWTSEQSFKAATQRVLQRASGLRDALWTGR